jgi:hypothetical protein
MGGVVLDLNYGAFYDDEGYTGYTTACYVECRNQVADYTDGA